MKRIITLGMCLCIFTLSANAQSSENEISVLFAYTTKAAVEAGGSKQLGKNVKNGLMLLNEALANSNVEHKVVAETKFLHVKDMSVSPDSKALIGELGQSDGKYNKIHIMRKKLKADLVCLIFDGGDDNSTSMGQLDGEFMVVTVNGAWGSSYIFPHEFGHVLGAIHDEDSESKANRTFNIKGTQYRTVSNNGGVSIPYFSDNRTIEYAIDGKIERIKIGDAGYQNAVTIRENCPKKTRLGDNLKNVKKAAGALEVEYVNPATAPNPPGTKTIFSLNSFSFSSNGNYKVKYVCHESSKEREIASMKLKFFDENGKEDPWLGSASSGLNIGDPAEYSGTAYEAQRIKKGYRAELWFVSKEDKTKEKLMAVSTIGGETKVLRSRLSKFK